jgi:hypothetical protein
MVAPGLRTEDVSGTEEGPARGGMGVTPHTGQRWASGDTSGEYVPRFRDVNGRDSFRPVPQPYYSERDMRNITAQQDPRRFTPPRPHHNGLSINATMSDGGDRPLGGPIISPRHWDRARVAQSAGVSSLDVATLGCQEYHGYKNEYYPLTQNIIFWCGYRNHLGNEVIACHHDIILLHRRVLDLWVNPRTHQRGPSVERILDKGLPVFPKIRVFGGGCNGGVLRQVAKDVRIVFTPVDGF